MNKIIFDLFFGVLFVGIIALATLSVTAEEVTVDIEKVDLDKFAKSYFDSFVASQAPDATTKELEAYLALLKDDVGHTHLPWQTDDARLPDGKESMRKGMTFYLGVHTEYKAELLDVFSFNDSAVAIRYKHHAKGIHPQSKQPVEYTQTMMEVLEIEDGKVGMIRKYHE